MNIEAQELTLSEAYNIVLQKAQSTKLARRRHQLQMREQERKLQRPVKEFMDYMTKKLKAGISGMRGKTAAQKAQSIVNWNAIREEGEKILQPAILEVLTAGATPVIEELMRMQKQERIDPIGVQAINWSTAHSAELVVEITEDTMLAIRDIITTGVNAGKSMPAIARELRPIVGLHSQYAGAVEKFHTSLLTEGVNAQKAAAKAETYANRLHRRRTQTIARTETAFGLTEGQIQGYSHMGATHLERVEDPDACDICAEYNGNVYSIKEAEGVLPEHPNCEGTWVLSGKIEPPGKYAEELSSRARKYEPGITRSMKGIASDAGVTLNKLEFRLKTPGSIERKMASIAKGNPFISMKQIAKGIEDSVRYTAIAPTKNFASIINQIDLLLSRQGYKLKKVTNYYGKKGPYQGINAKYFDPKSKLTFEIQFHTKQSITIVDKNHLLYDKTRISTSPELVTKLNAQMIKNWDDFVMPQGAENLFRKVKIEFR